jgi:ubiquinone/menaquinone biosynthesis C-methylase UbiE
MDPWSLFWQQGHSTTFGDYFKQGYEGAVANWWQSFLVTLEAGDSVLEVACGNCSLLPALIDSGIDARYIGVDIADVKPSAVAEQRLCESNVEVRLHSATPAENIPEPDGSVTLIASVFGIEYSDLDRSLAEVLRLLKSGGQFCALLHHDESIVTTMSRRAISEYNRKDLGNAIDALSIISRERDKSASVSMLKTNPKAEKGRKKINALAQKYLQDANIETANATMFEFMNSALKFFKMINAPSTERRRFISSLENEHKASNERFRQMVSVALDAEKAKNLQTKLLDLGFVNPQIEVVYTNKDILAWGLSAGK